MVICGVGGGEVEEEGQSRRSRIKDLGARRQRLMRTFGSEGRRWDRGKGG